jgi:hypothetical protein
MLRIGISMTKNKRFCVDVAGKGSKRGRFFVNRYQAQDLPMGGFNRLKTISNPAATDKATDKIIAGIPADVNPVLT